MGAVCGKPPASKHDGLRGAGGGAQAELTSDSPSKQPGDASPGRTGASKGIPASDLAKKGGTAWGAACIPGPVPFLPDLKSTTDKEEPTASHTQPLSPPSARKSMPMPATALVATSPRRTASEPPSSESSLELLRSRQPASVYADAQSQLLSAAFDTPLAQPGAIVGVRSVAYATPAASSAGEDIGSVSSTPPRSGASIVTTAAPLRQAASQPAEEQTLVLPPVTQVDKDADTSAQPLAPTPPMAARAALPSPPKPLKPHNTNVADDVPQTIPEMQVVALGVSEGDMPPPADATATVTIVQSSGAGSHKVAGVATGANSVAVPSLGMASTAATAQSTDAAAAPPQPDSPLREGSTLCARGADNVYSVPSTLAGVVSVATDDGKSATGTPRAAPAAAASPVQSIHTAAAAAIGSHSIGAIQQQHTAGATSSAGASPSPPRHSGASVTAGRGGYKGLPRAHSVSELTPTHASNASDSAASGLLSCRDPTLLESPFAESAALSADLPDGTPPGDESPMAEWERRMAPVREAEVRVSLFCFVLFIAFIGVFLFRFQSLSCIVFVSFLTM